MAHDRSHPVGAHPVLRNELARLTAADERIAAAEALLLRQQQLMRSFQRIGDIASALEAERVLASMERAVQQHVAQRRLIAALVHDLIAGPMRNVGHTVHSRAGSLQPALRRAA